jgi:hypothetical protein
MIDTKEMSRGRDEPADGQHSKPGGVVSLEGLKIAVPQYLAPDTKTPPANYLR